MYWKLAFRNIKRNLFMSGLIVILLMMVCLLVMSTASSLEVKLNDYAGISPYLKENGKLIVSMDLANPDTKIIIRDSKEIKEAFPNIEHILSVAEVWDSYLGDDPNHKLNTWCYSQEVIDMMTPTMEAGRWFSKRDKDSEVLKGVISHNKDGIQVGDVLTIGEPFMDVQIQVEIIGVMNDKESVFYHSPYAEETIDYRECFSTYNYKAEGEIPLLILSEAQILENEQNPAFAQMNFRVSDIGFHKSVNSGTLITFKEGTTEKQIDEDISRLCTHSGIEKVFDLAVLQKNSIKYIEQDMYSVVPMLVCVFVFVIIATLSVSAVSVKRDLKHYALYYICGMQWKSSGLISLLQSAMLAGTAFILTMLSMIILQMKNVLGSSVLHLGGWQIAASVIMLVLYVVISWILPNAILRNTSARDVLIQNRE